MQLTTFYRRMLQGVHVSAVMMQNLSFCVLQVRETDCYLQAAVLVSQGCVINDDGCVALVCLRA